MHVMPGLSLRYVTRYQVSQWVWVDGSPLLYSNWNSKRDWLQSPTASMETEYENISLSSHQEVEHFLMRHQPRLSNNATCAAMVILGYFDMPWITVPCDLTMRNSAFICEVSKVGNRHLILDSNNLKLELLAYDYICPSYWTMVNMTCVSILQHRLPPLILPEGMMAATTDILMERSLWMYINIYIIYHMPRFSLKSKSANGYCALWQLKSNKTTFLPKHLEKKQINCSDNMGIPVHKQTPIPEIHTCHPGHLQCRNGPCISNLYQCDGSGQCTDNTDETDCEPICFNVSLPDKEKQTNLEDLAFSNTWCRSENCTPFTCQCNRKWFQCRSGGCIQFSFVCDGTVHCSDGTDELYCYEENDARIKLPLIPTTTVHQNECSNLTVPCTPFENSCFPVDKLCVFERGTNRSPSFCSNAGHVRGCSPLECPGMFKCATAYCIPFYMVCNKAIDCPDGEDEAKCDVLKCKNLFRCSKEQTCINLHRIQDGRPQCSVTGEDEFAFHLVPCPPPCQCRGYVITCESQGLMLIPSFPIPIKALLVRGNKLQSLDHIFESISYSGILQLDVSQNLLKVIAGGRFPRTLLFLNMSYNRIAVIGKASFVMSTKLLEVDLQGNSIQILTKHSLVGLSNIQTLNFHDSGLQTISEFSFETMSHLKILNLSNNQLEFLDEHILWGLNSLQLLDIRGNKKLVTLPGSFLMLSNLIALVTDQSSACCFSNKTVICMEENAADLGYECSRIIPSTSLRIVLCLTCVFIIFFNLTSGMFWCQSIIASGKNKVKPFFLLPPLMNTADILYGSYLLIIFSFDLKLQDRFPVYRVWWLGSTPCTAAGVLSFLSVYLSFSLGFVISFYRYIAAVFPLKPSAFKTQIRTVFFFIAIISISGAGLLSLLLATSLEYTTKGKGIALHSLCFLMRHVKFCRWNETLISHALLVILNTAFVIGLTVLYSGICARLSEKRFESNTKREKRSKYAKIWLYITISSNWVSWIIICTENICMLAGFYIPYQLQLWVIVLLFPANSFINLISVTFRSSNFKTFLATMVASFGNNLESA